MNWPQLTQLPKSVFAYPWPISNTYSLLVDRYGQHVSGESTDVCQKLTRRPPEILKSFGMTQSLPVGTGARILVPMRNPSAASVKRKMFSKSYDNPTRNFILSKMSSQLASFARRAAQAHSVWRPQSTQLHQIMSPASD